MDGFAGNEEINTPTISQKETKQKDELYVGDAKIKADIIGAEREVMIHVVFDNETGYVYSFTFMQPKKISAANKTAFDRISDSIKVR